jgi:hypothetical protein
MMTYTFDQLKEDVRKEAEALRVHATQEERERLDFKLFNPYHYDGCIYGLATRDCHSKRAVQLIELCACRYFKPGVFDDIKQNGVNGIGISVNGVKVENFGKRANGIGKPSHFSAIEAYILLPEANNESLIAFLRGETDNLEL